MPRSWLNGVDPAGGFVMLGILGEGRRRRNCALSPSPARCAVSSWKQESSPRDLPRAFLDPELRHGLSLAVGPATQERRTYAAQEIGYRARRFAEGEADFRSVRFLP